MHCPRCDSPLSTAAVFCPQCGTRPDEPPPLSETLEAPAPPPPVPPERDDAIPPAHREPPPPFPGDVAPYLAVLRERFGYPDFRPGQAEVLTRLANRDVLGVMPTGGGKSLCYVLPALEVGRTLVVSPLIALMQDQVEALQAVGVPASFINSTLGRAEQNRRFQDFAAGRTALLYVAPERLANPRFLEGLRRHGVHLFVVDEAHCISEWGHDFRPDYLALGVARERLGEPRTLALTATADPVVRRDILARLGIAGRAEEILTSFDRPSLRFAVEPLATAGERLDWLVRYVRERPRQSGIVYARTRRAVEETAAALVAAGVHAQGYHAGMASGVRATVQRRFTTGEVPVIVATNAFGLGIDKPDVRFVVHLQMPGRLEAYYQEAGRAGRDGEPAECTLLYARRDHALQRRFIDQAHPDGEAVRRSWRRLVALQTTAPERPLTSGDIEEAAGGDGWPVTLTALRASGLVEPASLRLRSCDPDAPIDTRPIEERRRHAESRLAQMAEYAETSGCRRALILRYFGEEAPTADEGGCGACDSCNGVSRPGGPDYPLELFEAILALRDRLARNAGKPPYVVFEERTAREVATYRPHDEAALLATWGVGETRARWFGAQLLALVRDWEQAHPETASAPPRPAPAAKRGRASADAGPEVAFDDPLFENLREWRRDRARREGVPAYTFFTDRTARELVARRPADREGLHDIWGLGDARVEAIGDELLALIRAQP